LAIEVVSYGGRPRMDPLRNAYGEPIERGAKRRLMSVE
jgi:hypothetical protein